MSSSVAPRFPPTSVFIPAFWENARGELLTQDEADARYLKFPVGQGTESIPNLIVAGTSTLGITSASTLSLTDTTNNALTIGNGTSATGNMNFGSGVIQRLTATSTTNQSLSLYCENTALNSKYSQVQLRSGNNTTGKSSVELIAYQDDGLRYSDCLVQETYFDLNNKFIDAETEFTSGVRSYNEGDAPVATLYSLLYSAYTSPTDNYIGVRARTIQSSSVQSIEIFAGSALDTAVNIVNFGTGLITFYKNLTFNSNTGVLEKSNVEATTTGTLTMTSAYSFQTTINTPTANRTFVLPVASGQTTGTFYGICNKSTSFTIAVQAPSGTTIFTIPVASNSGGGSFAKFAVATGGTTYFRCG
jgi:hypothetical protein